jgi:hypothetical protein
MGSMPKIMGISRTFDEGMQEAVICLKLITTVLENCKGMVDHAIGDILDLLFDQLG